MGKQPIAMLVSNPLNPDPRVEKEACSLNEAGYQVTVLGWDREGRYPKQEMREGVRIERIHVRSGFNRRLRQIMTLPLFWAAALRVLCKGNFALVHCHDLDTLLPGVLWAKIHQRPVIFDAHEIYPEMMAPFIPSIVTQGVRTLERLLVRNVDAVITVGERTANVYQPFCSQTLIVGNYPVLPDISSLLSTTSRLRQELGIPPQALALGYIGALHSGRQFAPLLEALQHEPSTHLIVGGRGAQEEALRQRARRMPNLHLVGFVNPDDVLKMLFALDAVYYGLKAENPNNYYSTPNALFNTLAVGRPVLCTNVGEIAKIVQKEACGIVSAPTPEAMCEAIEHLHSPELREAMGTRARAAAELRYNWRIAESRLLDLYKVLLSERER